MAGKIKQKSLKSFLNISAYGIILVFVTNQAVILLNAPFPPLGLMTGRAGSGKGMKQKDLDAEEPE